MSMYHTEPSLQNRLYLYCALQGKVKLEETVELESHESHVIYANLALHARMWKKAKLSDVYVTYTHAEGRCGKSLLKPEVNDLLTVNSLEQFSTVSKVIRDCIGFALLRSVIGQENSRHPLNQSDAKLKAMVTWSLAFSRALGRFRVFTLSPYWLLVMLTFVLIGHCGYFGFGFTTLNRKALYSNDTWSTWGLSARGLLKLLPLVLVCCLGNGHPEVSNLSKARNKL